MVGAWLDIEKTLEKLDLPYARVIACMTIDYVAKKSGLSSVEFMDFIRPTIEEVNDEYGTI